MIRELKISELYKLTLLAKSFTDASDYIDVDMDCFVKNWRRFIESRVGTIIVCDKGTEFAGAIGALIYPDPNNGEIIASEMFWIVHPEHRGCGIRLLRAFEKWGRNRGCNKLVMCHMVDSMPEIVKKIYTRLGYNKMEIHYIKDS